MFPHPVSTSALQTGCSIPYRPAAVKREMSLRNDFFPPAGCRLKALLLRVAGNADNACTASCGPAPIARIETLLFIPSYSYRHESTESVLAHTASRQTDLTANGGRHSRPHSGRALPSRRHLEPA